MGLMSRTGDVCSGLERQLMNCSFRTLKCGLKRSSRFCRLGRQMEFGSDDFEACLSVHSPHFASVRKDLGDGDRANIEAVENPC